MVVLFPKTRPVRLSYSAARRAVVRACRTRIQHQKKRIYEAVVGCSLPPTSRRPGSRTPRRSGSARRPAPRRSRGRKRLAPPSFFYFLRARRCGAARAACAPRPRAPRLLACEVAGLGVCHTPARLSGASSYLPLRDGGVLQRLFIRETVQSPRTNSLAAAGGLATHRSTGRFTDLDSAHSNLYVTCLLSLSVVFLWS